MRIKICGTCSVADLDASVRAGADAVGFVVEYPDPVPWDLDRREAARLIGHVPPFVSSVVVTTGDPSTVEELAAATGPHAVQLHGDESVDTVADTVDRLSALGVRTFKAISLEPDDDRSEVRRAAREFASAGVDALVVDARAPDRRGGGTGTAVPFRLAREVAECAPVPTILAGGLTADNVVDAIDAVDPYGVDVISGVERERRRKDPDAMAAFVAAAKGTDRQ